MKQVSRRDLSLALPARSPRSTWRRSRSGCRERAQLEGKNGPACRGTLPISSVETRGQKPTSENRDAAANVSSHVAAASHLDYFSRRRRTFRSAPATAPVPSSSIEAGSGTGGGPPLSASWENGANLSMSSSVRHDCGLPLHFSRISLLYRSKWSWYSGGSDIPMSNTT